LAEFVFQPLISGSYNVYTWGDNSNYTLGHGKESRTLHPEVVDMFRKKQYLQYHDFFGWLADSSSYTSQKTK